MEAPIFMQAPRGALIYSPKDNLTFKALYGEAYRLPNLWETNASMPRFMASTPHIQPERINTAELGVDSRPAQWMTARGAAYYSRVPNLIERRNALNAAEDVKLGAARQGGFTTNLFDYRFYGAEMGLQAYFTEKWSAFFNSSVQQSRFSYVDARYTEAAGWYRRTQTASLLMSAGLGWKPVKWLALKPNSQLVGHRGASSTFLLHNAVVDFLPMDRLTLSLIAENYTNRQYTYPETVRRHVQTLPGGPGRSFYGRVTAEF